MLIPCVLSVAPRGVAACHLHDNAVASGNGLGLSLRGDLGLHFGGCWECRFCDDWEDASCYFALTLMMRRKVIVKSEVMRVIILLSFARLTTASWLKVLPVRHLPLPLCDFKEGSLLFSFFLSPLQPWWKDNTNDLGSCDVFNHNPHPLERSCCPCRLWGEVLVLCPLVLFSPKDKEPSGKGDGFGMFLAFYKKGAAVWELQITNNCDYQLLLLEDDWKSGHQAREMVGCDCDCVLRWFRGVESLVLFSLNALVLFCSPLVWSTTLASPPHTPSTWNKVHKQ